MGYLSIVWDGVEDKKKAIMHLFFALTVKQLHVDDLIDSNSAIIFDKQSNIFIMNARHYDLDSRNASTSSLVYLASELIYPSEVLEEQGHDLPTCPVGSPTLAPVKTALPNFLYDLLAMFMKHVTEILV